LNHNFNFFLHPSLFKFDYISINNFPRLEKNYEFFNFILNFILLFLAPLSTPNIDTLKDIIREATQEEFIYAYCGRSNNYLLAEMLNKTLLSTPQRDFMITTIKYKIEQRVILVWFIEFCLAIITCVGALLVSPGTHTDHFFYRNCNLFCRSLICVGQEQFSNVSLFLK